MATTDNLGLYLPQREDYISVSRDISQSMQKIDDAFSANVGGIAIIANGDIHAAITNGQYVYVENNTHSLSDGMYVATANIAENGTIDSSVVSNSSLSSGGGALNVLNDHIVSITPLTKEVTVNKTVPSFDNQFLAIPDLTSTNKILGMQYVASNGQNNIVFPAPFWNSSENKWQVAVTNSTNSSKTAQGTLYVFYI